jgi:hypothetical protein
MSHLLTLSTTVSRTSASLLRCYVDPRLDFEVRGICYHKIGSVVQNCERVSSQGSKRCYQLDTRSGRGRQLGIKMRHFDHMLRDVFISMRGVG